MPQLHSCTYAAIFVRANKDFVPARRSPPEETRAYQDVAHPRSLTCTCSDTPVDTIEHKLAVPPLKFTGSLISTIRVSLRTLLLHLKYQNGRAGTVVSNYQISPPLLALIAAWSIYCLVHSSRHCTLYNISSFHPLHSELGPKLAAATYLVEFWYDVGCFGLCTMEIRKMHEICGTVA